MKKFIFALSLYSVTCLVSNPSQPDALEETSSSKDVAKISEAFGHLIGKNLDSMGLRFDMAKVIQGLKDASDGKAPPMSEAECIQAITTAQEIAFKQVSQENLAKAENFLNQNLEIKGVHPLEENKVQYIITHEGEGASVDESSTPLIRYTGKFLDGSIFGSSQEAEPVRLDETIPGFSKGLLGMKEGEKRTVFIHPDLGYGTQGDLPPNSLLTFDIEVIKANSPLQEEIPSSSPIFKGSPEIATPFEDSQAIR
ncbi:MAG: FKBP-type peptidyl-prolyl cis-trans isomerase [Candidatus Rhabdochlamydia sp.]